MTQEEQNIEQAAILDYREQIEIERLIDECCKEIPYEGTEVDKGKLREEIQQYKQEAFIIGAKSPEAKAFHTKGMYSEEKVIYKESHNTSRYSTKV